MGLQGVDRSSFFPVDGIGSITASSYKLRQSSFLSSPWQGIVKLLPARESLVSDNPAGNGKIANLFLHCRGLDLNN